MRMPVLPLKLKTVLNGRYEIVKVIGHGGFGNTYSVYNGNLDTYCVVKEFALDQICVRDIATKTIIVLDGYEPTMEKWRAKFVIEAQNLAKIKHQGVVSVFEVWEENGTVYYAMDHIKGGELLNSRAKEWKPIAWTEAKKITVALLKALQAVHKVDLLHGDIKPANILIDQESKLPILIDFGTARSLAKAQDETATSLASTVGYAPIELQDFSRSKEANPSSDLYSWAMVVIGLVAKHRDYGWPIDAKTRIMLNKGNLDEYSEKFLHKWLANSLPTPVISILANCLQLNSNQRPKSVSIVLDQLENLSISKTFNFKAVTVGIVVVLFAFLGFVYANINQECAENEYVFNNICTSCEAGSVNEAGDDASGLNTFCEAIFCGENEYVFNNFCESCVAGSLNETGDDALGSNTLCEAILCAENEYVSNHICEPCVGSTNEIGDNALVANTICDPILCTENEYVGNHICIGCAVGLRNEAGDNASGENTSCEAVVSEGFVLIPAGSFIMGSPENEVERTRWNNDEQQHHVRITRSFYMQRHEVTQGEWQTLMGNNPSYFSPSGDGASCGSDCPVENVNWWEALAYANALSISENLQECYILSGCRNSPGNDMECSDVSWNSNCLGYRLPTEAEWEYAARAGTRTMFYNGEETPDDIAWYENNSNDQTHLVAQLEANSWELYDMSGNVWEWCWDLYDVNYYNLSPVNDPMGANSSSTRLLRGGAWNRSASLVRSARRIINDPDNRNRYYGFRLVSLAP